MVGLDSGSLGPGKMDVEAPFPNPLDKDVRSRLHAPISVPGVPAPFSPDKATRAQSTAVLDAAIPPGDEEAYPRVLRRTRRRLAEAGVPFPTVTIRFLDLTVFARPRLGESNVPTLPTAVGGMALAAMGRTGRVRLEVVSRATGVLRPGRFTLLLGPPSSGKSVFMRALAGQLPSGLAAEGGMTYNGVDAVGTGRRGGVKDFVPQRVSGYVQQHDVHYGELSVRETVDFSARCLGAETERELVEHLLASEAAGAGRARGRDGVDVSAANGGAAAGVDVPSANGGAAAGGADVPPAKGGGAASADGASASSSADDAAVDAALESLLRLRALANKDSPIVEQVLRILGLDHVAETLVGNQMLRGISGGQKKRLGTAEVKVGAPRALFADEISTGLDSNTTFAISKALRDECHITRATYLVALLQPGPETYDLFDDVLLIAGGLVVYHGPREGVLDVFAAAGFACPVRVSPAGFLQEVTTPGDQLRFWDRATNRGGDGSWDWSGSVLGGGDEDAAAPLDGESLSAKGLSSASFAARRSQSGAHRPSLVELADEDAAERGGAPAPGGGRRGGGGRVAPSGDASGKVAPSGGVSQSAPSKSHASISLRALGYSYVTPRRFQQVFRSTPYFAALEAEIRADLFSTDAGAGPSAGARAVRELRETDPLPDCPTVPLTLPKNTYGAPAWSAVRANFARSLQLQVRTKAFAIVRLFQVCLMSFALATLFIKTPTDSIANGNQIMSIIFFGLMIMLIGGVAEMTLITERLPVFYKQRDALCYPGWAFAVPSFIFRIPFAFVDATVWSCVTYFAVGLTRSYRFFVFWFAMFLMSTWAVSMFQALAAVCQVDTISNAVGAFMMLVFLLTGGFIVNKGSIPDWWIGAYWANPWSYITQGVAVNEFTTKTWDKPNPALPDSPLNMGEQILAYWHFHSGYRWVWIGVGTVLISTAINVFAFVLACSLMPPPHAPPIVAQDDLDEMHFNRTDGAEEPPEGMARELQTSAKHLAAAEAAAEAEEVVEEQDERGDQGTADPAKGVAPSGGGLGDAGKANGAGRAPAASPANGAGRAPAASPANGAGRAPVAPPADGASSAPSPPVSPRKHADVLSAGLEVSRDSAHGGRASLSRASFDRAAVAVARRSSLLEEEGVVSVASVLPFRPLSMTFRDVSYSVPIPKGMDVSQADVPADGPHAGALRLLQGIDGAFRPGVLSALMGASGAGKTTLMDVLAGRKTGGTVTGEVHVDGFPKVQLTFNRVAGYVEQEDVHLPQTTVREALEFSAALRLPSSVSPKTREQFVDEVMTLVELTRLSGAFVGVGGESGLSIQQRKRLTIAVELVANPSILFLDEPTTGLDARAASIVMSTVRNVVDTGRTVVCTIHQPSLDIFEEFDELLLLKPGGRCIFFGAIGVESRHLIRYFSSIPGVAGIRPGVNPADWMLEQTNPGNEKRLGVDFAEVYLASEQRAGALESIDAAHAPAPGAEDLAIGDLEVSTPIVQFFLLLRRLLRMYWRAPDYNVSRFFITLLVAFVVGSLAWRQGNKGNTTTGLLNAAGLLYISTIFIGFTNAMTIMPVVITQRNVMWRERAAGMYGVVPYAAAQGIVELPYIVVQTVLYSAVVYWMLWFARDASKFFWFCFFFGLTLLAMTTFGMCVVALTPELPIATLLASFCFGFWNLFCGFLQTQPNIRGWWIWMYWLNVVSYTLYGLIVSQYGNVHDVMVEDFDGNLVSVSAFIESYFGYKESMLGPLVAIMIAFIVLFRAGTYAALKYLQFQNR